MVSSLNEFTVTPPTSYMMTPQYKRFIESMLPVLLTSTESRVLPLTPSQGSIDKGDLTGFLLDNGHPLETHFVIMRMNNMNSVHDFDETYRFLRLPDPNILGILNSIYESSILSN